ncbi:MAG: GNAT family N-acetyltransferase [Nitrospirae bacterium]|nr:GNAT family N-acetyltransferase [Nitrospirota bacterium]
MDIDVIDESSSYLEDVIKLGDENRARLGFLPRGAYQKFSNQNQIIIAIDKNKEFLGYILYKINRENFAYIVHLCIKESQRKKGIASELFKKLKIRTKDNKGIRVHCRIDYNIDNLWLGLDFKNLGKMPGRSKDGSTLKIWWFDHNNLFNLPHQEGVQSKQKVTIDANVFYDLSNNKNEESLSLLADWLSEDVELCLTQEIFNEIDRNPSELERQSKREFANTFSKLPILDTKIQKVRSKLESIFPTKMSDSMASDLSQLAMTIAADIQFFITRDSGLLKKADQIDKEFGLNVIRPADFIINQDELLRKDEYQASRLSGTSIIISRINKSTDIASVAEEFREMPEKITEFRQRLWSYISDPHKYISEIIKLPSNENQCLILQEWQNQQELNIPVFRVKKSPKSIELARYLIFRAIRSTSISSAEINVLIRVTDTCFSEYVINALREFGFKYINGCWIKVNINLVGTSKELSERIISFTKEFPDTINFLEDNAEVLKTKEAAEKEITENNNIFLRIEKSFFPAKIQDIKIPSFIVSIKPEWALNLFDEGSAKQDLFGGQPKLILNSENVYYCTCHKYISAPARLLWYVSKGKSEYHESMSIKACSYLDEVVIDEPKRLFRRFKHLGIYQWKDIRELPKDNSENEIMAFRFSFTEIFSNPVKRPELQEIWQKESGRNFYILRPIEIPIERFFNIYNRGFKIKKDDNPI